MTTDLPAAGTVIRYPCLWAAGQKSGETAGRKPRPVCLVLRLRDPKRSFHHPIPLPIAGKLPAADRISVEIPEVERRRAGLTRYERAC